MNIRDAVLYELTIDGKVELEGFLAELSPKILEGAKAHPVTRIGGFERMSVLYHGYPVKSDDDEALRTKYLFLVEGYMGKLDWVVEILASYGEVSLPVGEDAWSSMSDYDIAYRWFGDGPR